MVMEKFCPNCGHARIEKSRFCGGCGYRFQGMAPMGQQVPAAPQAPPQQPVAGSTRSQSPGTARSPSPEAKAPITQAVPSDGALRASVGTDHWHSGTIVDRPTQSQVGETPRVPPERSAAPALPVGWHRGGDGSRRYWNGSRWTHQVVDGQVVDIAEVPVRHVMPVAPFGSTVNGLPELAYGPEYLPGRDCANCGFTLGPTRRCAACEI